MQISDENSNSWPLPECSHCYVLHAATVADFINP